MLYIRLSKEMKQKLQVIAEREFNNQSGIAGLFVKRGIEQYEKEHGKIK